jgi:predicted nucleic acid-binding Zn ribbon protein
VDDDERRFIALTQNQKMLWHGILLVIVLLIALLFRG